jgi:hypothetical protein
MTINENDPTINDKFVLRVFSRRWTQEIAFMIQRTSAGWFVPTPLKPHGGLCDRWCSPHLYELLRYAGIEYPNNVGERFHWLWEQASEKSLNHEAVQQGIDEIGQWISNTDQNALVTGFWEGVA